MGHARPPLRRDVVYARIRDGVLDGSLPSGTKLPSTRAYAVELGVARGTVEEAYARLAAEGYVVALGAAGTRVRSLSWGTKGRAPPDVEPPTPTTDDAWADGRGRPLGLGSPALSELPFDAWSRAIARAARSTRKRELLSTEVEGELALRAALARHVGLGRGVACTPSQIIVTSGYQAGLTLAALATVGSGGTAYVEDPGYPSTRAALEALGLRTVHVRVDHEGLSVDALGHATSALVTVTAAHQMPLGMSLSLERRLALVEWARRGAGRFIVEDDYDGDFHYAGAPLPALFAVDRYARTLYAGTFSKALFPAARMGFLVVPLALVDRVRSLCGLVAPSPAPVLQRALADFIDAGALARHLAKMRRLYARRRAAVLGALHAELGGEVEIVAGSGGLHIVVLWRGGPSDEAVARRAATRAPEAARLGVRALRTYRVGRSNTHGLLVGFANVPERTAPAAVARLACAFRERD